MKTTDPVDTARLALLLAKLRLPAVKLVWADLAAQADKEGWPAARFLAVLAEHEITERSRRRIERHLTEAKLPPGKTLDTFDFEAVPVVSKAQVMALAAGDAWLDRGANLIPGLRRGRLCSGRQAPERATWRQRSASLSSKTAGVCCSPGPPISFSGCKSPAAILPSKLLSPSSTSTTC